MLPKCPACGQIVSIQKVLFLSYYSSTICQNCGTELKVKKKRYDAAFIGGIGAFIGTFVLLTAFRSWSLVSILLVAAWLIGLALVVYFTTELVVANNGVRKPGAWITNYIRKHRHNQSRYEIDLFLINMGFDPKDIDAAWQAQPEQPTPR